MAPPSRTSQDVPLRKMFFWTSVVGTGLGLTQLVLVTGTNRALGIPDQAFAIGDSLRPPHRHSLVF